MPTLNVKLIITGVDGFSYINFSDETGIETTA